MLKTVVAIDKNILGMETLTMRFDIPSKDFDLVSAVKNAATDYCKTKQGKAICRCYNYLGRSFSWADFAPNIPNEFLQKYGFEIVDWASDFTPGNMIVDMYDQLVDGIDCDDDEEEA